MVQILKCMCVDLLQDFVSCIFAAVSNRLLRINEKLKEVFSSKLGPLIDPP